MDYSPWGHKESDMTERLHFFNIKKVLLGPIQGHSIVIA